ncbi:MAG: F-box protein: endocytic membrane traffic, recycling ReCYcling 1 [Chrysothrix sp. TS-e1954]|nr:MAG: F-box protein: endocytic membrane traffic, recycling ReCYcling 1 [Chrysothrix sp. TS-e1954]
MSSAAVRSKTTMSPPSARSPAIGRGSTTFLSAMRATTMVGSKPVLPAEILATILDYLPTADLMHVARASRRMREMVYDDTRWVSKLRSMGCWNEAEARSRADEALRRRNEAMSGRPADGQARSMTTSKRDSGTASKQGARRQGSITVFDPGSVDRYPPFSPASASINGLSNDFDAIALHSNQSDQNSISSWNPEAALNVLKKVRSIRGSARYEYAKVYRSLAPFYFDIARSQKHSHPELFKIYRDPLQQAKMLAQMKIFARSDHTQGWQERENMLESISAVFENAALREFEQGYQTNDIDGRMRTYGHVLVALNGGAAAVDLFCQNHRLMQRRHELGNALDCLQTSTSTDVDLKVSNAFFQRLSSSLVEEVAVIDRVFPPTIDVLLPFLDRIQEDIISEYITPLFDEAHSKSIEAYLKVVAGVYEQSRFFARSLRPSQSSPVDFQMQAARIVDRCFVPHVDLYLAEELEFFRSRCNAEVDRWEKQLKEQEASAESFFMSNVNRQAAKQDFLTSFKKVLMAPVNVLPTFSTSKQTTTDTLSTGETLRTDTPSPSNDPANRRSVSPRPEAPTTELAAKAAIMNSKLEGIGSLFSIEVALTLVHMAKSSIERAAHFAHIEGQHGKDATEQCETIFIDLLDILGFRHIKPGFDKAVGHLSLYSARKAVEHGQSGVQPLVTFLELVNVGDLIQQMVDVFYAQELVAPRLTDRDDFLNPAVKDKKRFEQMLDERVAAGLNKGIDVLMDEVEYICATTQAATDFNPGATGKSDDGLLDIGPTPTADRVVRLVSSHTSMLVGSTDKNMLDVFNQEVGVRLFTAICKHVKRQRISVQGAIKLISDTNHYFGYVQTLKNRALLPYFKALRELSQLFLVESGRGKEIAAIIADGDRYHGVFRAEEVYEFAERRADWYSMKRDVEKAMYGIGCAVM